MRVAFMGFQTWGLITLRAILDAGHDVVHVVTHPQSENPYAKHFDDSIADFAVARQLPLTEADKVTDDVARVVASSQPELIVSSNWRRVIPQSVLAPLPYGGINVHRSLLPRYGGVAPINWAVANGETETGVTIHRLAAEVDLGDILLQEALAIGPTDTATEVFHRTTPVVQRLIPQALAALSSGTAIFTKQNADLAEFFHPRGERELRIDWSRTNVDVFNLVRAQSDPFANAFTMVDGKKVAVKRASLAPKRYMGTPGRICDRSGDAVVVLCGRSSAGQGLVIHSVARDGEETAVAEAIGRIGSYLS